jgi:hypoxanthine phosphoribosyltransferase
MREEETVGKLLIREDEIRKRVRELGRQITEDFANEELCVVSLLKGAFVFTADLIREISLPLEVDFIAVSSYGTGTSSTGVVKLLKDLDINIESKNVLIVDDIIDSGLTLRYLVDHIKAMKPAVVKTCVLLDRPARRKTNIKVDYVGFEIPDYFVIGYGLDYAYKYRNLPYISILREE